MGIVGVDHHELAVGIVGGDCPSVVGHLAVLLEGYPPVDRVLQVALAVLGAGAAILVATFTNELGIGRAKRFSFVAALSFGVLSGFDIGGRRMRRAAAGVI